MTNLDELYIPFPSFSEWTDCFVDDDIWDAKKSHRDSFIGDPPSMSLNETTLEVTRMAAYDTGALENLYETDRGITKSFAQFAGIVPEVFPDAESEEIHRLVGSQLAAYELTIDAVTQKIPISEVWIREIHKQICASQDEYDVFTAIGKQRHPLPKGEYKKYSNHVQLPDNGGFFAYAPVKDTEHEVRRLLTELNSPEFQNAHCTLQAAYAHYAFVRIHPFADGNGRVSRVIASLYLYREASIPLLIFADQRDDYLYNLRQADNDNFQSFVDFVFERAADTLDIQTHYIQAKSIPSTSQSMSAIREALYKTEVIPSKLNEIAIKLLTQVKASLDEQISKEVWVEGIRASCEIIEPSLMVEVSPEELIFDNIRMPEEPRYHSKGYYLSTVPEAESQTPVLALTIQSSLGDDVEVEELFPLFIESDKFQNPIIMLGYPNSGLLVNVKEIKREMISYKMKLDLWSERTLRSTLNKFQTQFMEKYNDE